MSRRRDDDEDDDDIPRRRRRKDGGSKAPLYVGIGVAVAAVVFAVIVTVIVRRGGRGLEREEVTEGGVRIVTPLDGSGEKQYLPPADGRPYGMRMTKDGTRPDLSVLTEGWGLMLGKWERTDQQGKIHVAEFRANHTATMTLRFAEGLKTSEYELACLTDLSEFRPLRNPIRRKYTVELRPAGQRDKEVTIQCDILADGTIATGSNETLPYKRVR